VLFTAEADDMPQVGFGKGKKQEGEGSLQGHEGRDEIPDFSNRSRSGSVKFDGLRNPGQV
jgi:hypothetical protein